MMKRLLFSISLLMLGSFIWAQNFPFPQNVDYDYGITVATPDNTKIQNLYSSWVSEYVETGTVQINGVNTDAARVRFDVATQTVSEGIAYGMLISVYMDNSTNNSQAQFDKLYNYYSGFGRFQSGTRKYLMEWKINGFSSVVEAGSATDADIDVALALLMAHKQWGSTSSSYGINYIAEAETLMAMIYDKQTSGNVVKPGDHWDGAYNPCYFEVAAFNLFDEVQSSMGFTSTRAWSSVVSKSYEFLANAQNDNSGLYPDWCNYDGSERSSDPKGYNFSWDACRTPWRIIWDYAWFGNTSAQSLSQTTASWVKTNVTAASCATEYTLAGSGITTSYQSPCFVGGLGSAFMLNSTYSSDLQTWYNQSLNLNVGAASGKIAYYGETLQILYALTMSGSTPNFYANSGPQPARLAGNIQTDVTTGTELTLTFNKDLQTVSGTAATSFSVTVDGTATTVTSLAYSGSAPDQIVLVIGNATVTGSSIIKVSYNGTIVKDIDGLTVATFTNQDVKNNLPGQGTMLCDFESNQTTSLGTEVYTFAQGPSTSIDPLTTDTDKFTTTAGGASGSDNAGKISFILDETGITYNPLAGLGFAFTEPEGAYDLSASSGLSFWYKGAGFSLELALTTITNDQNFIILYPEVTVWTKVDITWSATDAGLFEQPDWGLNNIYVDWDLTKASKLQWKVQDVDGTSGELWVDQVMLLTTSTIDKSALVEAISTAQGLSASAVAGTDPGQYPASAITALNSAITTAQGVASSTTADQDAIDIATTALIAAISTFNAAKIPDPNTIIADCEDGNLTKLGSYWFSFDDSKATTSPSTSGSSTIDPLTDIEDFTMTLGGANGTDSAAKVDIDILAGGWAYDGFVGVGIELVPDGSPVGTGTGTDWTGATGFSFYAKGTGLTGYTITFTAESSIGAPYVSGALTVGTAWSKIDVSLSELAVPQWWKTANPTANPSTVIDPTAISKIQWQIAGPDANGLTFWVDEVTVEGVSLNLTPIVNKTELNSLIGTADALVDAASPGTGHNQYPTTAIATLNGAITDAGVISASTSATQADVDAELIALQDAIDAFNATKITVSFTALDSKIAEATALLASSPGNGHNQYPTTSTQRTALVNAIAAGSAISGVNGTTTTQVSSQITAITSAMTAFQSTLINVDFSSLQTLVDEAGAILDTVTVGTTPGTWLQGTVTQFEGVVNTSGAAIGITGTTAAQVADNVTSLQSAISVFENAYIKNQTGTTDFTNLQLAVNVANGMLTTINANQGTGSGQYTPADVTAFVSVITTSEAMITAATATQVVVDAQILALNQAAIDIERSALSNTIDAAQAAQINIGTAPGQHPQSAADLLNSVIDTYDDLLTASTTATAVVSAVSEIESAVVTFNLTVNGGTIDVTALNDLIAVATSVSNAAQLVVGNNAGQYDVSSILALNNAISVATAVKDSPTSDAQVATAIADLQDAILTIHQSALLQAIEKANDIVDVNIGTGSGQYPQSASDALKSVIGTAELVILSADEYSEVAQIVGSLLELVSAIETFKGSVQTGVNDLENTVTIYPNPASDIVNIDVAGLEKVIIANSTGQIVIESNESSIDVSGLAHGTYNVTIIADDAVYSTVIIK